MKSYSIRAIPAAAAMVAALVFGVQVQAQTGSGLPPGSTNPKDASVKTGPAARAGAEANNSSGSPVGKSATMTPGTTNPKDNVNPSPAGVAPARMAAPGMAGADATATGIAGTTNPKDASTLKPSMSKTAEQRAMAKADRKAKRDAKRASRASKKKTEINNSAETAGGSMGSTATTPSR